MASAIAFDTHAYVKKLKSAGVSEEAAEVQAEAMVGLIEDRLATKQELFGVETALKRDIKELETSLRRDTKELETSLRRDIKELETNLRREIKESEASLRQEMKKLDVGLRQEMKELEMRMTMRLGAMMVVAVGVVATLVKIL